MKFALLVSIGCMALGMAAQAEVEPVTVRVPKEEAWTGQRIPFYIELRARGSFAGTARFDLPELPGTMIMKIGNPIVDSREIDGESWFVQTHEFALFSQMRGTLDVPSFPIQFSHRDGYTGPVNDIEVQAAGFHLEIACPPGAEQVGFQRTEQLPGMALAPAPTTAPDGIRVYPGQAETNDQLERGDFRGERRETLSYLMQKPGTLSLPEITYVWWNPKTQELKSKTLPVVSFEVTAAPGIPERPARRLWLWVLAGVLLIALAVWQRHRITAWVKQSEQKLNPPHRVAARKLLRACRQNNASAAEAAWRAWCATQGADCQPGPELRSAVLGMQRCIYGPAPTGSWKGAELARAFRRSDPVRDSCVNRTDESSLPQLNPTINT
jgi:hypothetical protein